MVRVRRAQVTTLVVASLLAVSFGLALPARAQTPAGVAEYLVPFDEDVFAYTTARVTNATIGPTSTSRSQIDVTTWSNSVVVYYDHWENGYGLDPLTLTGADETYTINTGQTLSFLSAAVPRPRTGADGNTYVGAAGACTGQLGPTGVSNGTNYCYDGRDRFVSVGGATTVTRGGWLEATDIHASVGEEVYPLAPQLIKYILPFGESTTRVDYNRVVVVIQATEDDTTLQIDFNGDGTYDSFNTENGYRTARTDPTDATTLTLDRGESYVLDRDSDGVGGTLNAGVVMLGDKTLQVEFFYGQNPSNYNTRAVAAYPRGFWSDEYYAPADGAPGGADTDVVLYNPNATTITINWQTTAGSGSFTMAPNETAFFQAKTGGYIPDGSALYLKGSDVFWGISDIDTNSSAWDWSYSLVPSYLLRPEQFVSWAPGNVPVQNPPGANGRALGVFVTPIQDNTTVFVDKNGDGAPDTTLEVIRGATAVTPTGSGYRANRLQSLYITDNDGDLTGARIWATGPFAMAYGENPQRTADDEGVDLGYTVLPSPADWMDLALTVDKATNPVIVSTVAGATEVTYTLTVDSHLFNLSTVEVVDTLPANWEFIANSATITFPNLTQLTGSAANPTVALPNLTWPSTLLGSMLPNQQITITFQARTTAAFTSGSLTQNTVQATGTRTVGAVTQTFTARSFAFNTYLNPAVNNMTVNKDTGAADPLSPGDTIPYTVTVTNTGSAALTGVSIFDTLPLGTSYVAGSGWVTCGSAASRTYVDNFGTVAYDNSNGSADWTQRPWQEMDDAGGGASSGLALVTGGALRLQPARNVRDEFGTVSYANSNGSTAWAGDWTETDPSGALGAVSGFVRVNGGTLQLRFATTTFADTFASGGYAGSTGTVSWEGSWVEVGDDGTAGGGSIGVDAGDRLELRAGTDANEGVYRVARLPGASAIAVAYAYDGNSDIDADDELRVEYSSDGSSWTTLRTIAGNTQGATYNDAVPAWSSSNEFFYLRIRSLDGIETGEEARFDNFTVTATFASAVGASVRRSANLSGATAATLTFSYTGANVGTGDAVVVEASADGTTFSTLETFTSTTANGTKTYNLLSPTSYASSATTIRFRVTGGFTATETVSIDNVDITWTAGAPSVQRSVNLTNATAATLTFTSGQNALEAGDVVVVEVASSPSGPFTVLGTATGAGAFTPAPSYNILSSASANTTIRFRVTGGFEAPNEYRTIDGVTVTYTSTGFPAADPPTFLAPAAACSIAGGGSATLTFSVTVDNPFPAGQTEILNVATAQAAEIPAPVSDDARNIVLNPAGASASVGDRVWLDSDGDGVLDVGEPGLPGVEVTLKDQWGTPLQITTTDSLGRYTFVGVPPGTGYFVEVTGGLPGGLTQTTDSRTDRRTASFNLAAGQSYDTADLGFQASAGTATIGDLVWSDADGDGIRDPGEPGLAGVVLNLREDTNGDNVPDANPKECFGVVRPDPAPYPDCTTTTGADGSYLFSGIVANGTRDYFVTVNAAQAALTGYTATTDAVAGFTNVPAGAGYTTADFGFQGGATTAYRITDRVWLDNGAGGGSAANGTQDGTEDGISGVTVALLDASGSIVATATTGANGNFQFTGVPAGQNYRWQVTDTFGVLSGYYGTTASAVSGQFQMTGNLSSNLDFTTAPTFSPHFGYNVTRAIGDTVFNDLDGSGTQNGSEAGINGVVVQLYLDRNGNGAFEPTGADGPPVATLTTDANGKYLFAGLPDGRYWVNVDPAQSALSGYTTRTTPDENAASGDQRLVVLSGASNLDADFGYRADTSYTISGNLWDDGNGNAVDDGEAGLAGVTLELVRNGVVIATTTTDAAGDYSFPGLPGGSDYTVRITDVNGVLSGYTTTYEKSLPPYDGEETVTNLNANVTDLHFGFYKPIPVPVSLSWFRATPGRQGVRFEWETSAETGNVGFNLYGEAGGVPVRLNRELIASKVVDSLWPVSYEYEAETSARLFWLEEVDLYGETRRHGPFGFGIDVGRKEERQAVPWEAVRRESREKELGRATTAATGAASLLVSSDGMVRVTYEQLLAAGFDWRGMAAGGFELTNRGRAVPILVNASVSGTSAKFGPGSSIVFWGERVRSLYTDENVYRLTASAVAKTSPSRIQAASAAPNLAASPATSYRETETVDRNLGYSFSSPTGDPWHEKQLLAYRTPVKGVFPIEVRDVARGADAELTVRLWGSTDWPASPDHRVVLRWNGVDVGKKVFDGIVDATVTVTIPANLLKEGTNDLEVEVPGDTGVDWDLVVVDSYALTYSRTFRAVGDRLAFAGGRGPYSVSGLSSSEAYVFWKSGTSSDVYVGTGTVVEAAEKAYRLRFGTAQVAETRQYRVASASGWASARIEPARTATNLLADPPAVSLIVSHPDFIAGLEPLVAARRAAGVSVKVVDVRDVYEAYSGGVLDPAAIRAFVKAAWVRWKVRSLLLVGGDTYDYFDNLGLGSKSFIPTLYAETDPVVVKYAPADPLFGDVTGDGVPEVAVGRLPVRTSAELQAVIGKTLAWTNAGSAVLAADLAEGGLRFSTLSDEMATKLPPGLPLRRAYMDTLGIAGARTELRSAMNGGNAFVSYFGHSSYTRWSFSSVFTSADAAALANAGHPLVVNQLGCWNTYFVDPKYDTLGHVLLLSGDRGAVAAMGNATLTDVSSDVVFGPILMEKLSQPKKTLGQAILEAKVETGRVAPGRVDVQAGFTLLGDPEVVVFR